MTAKEKRQMRTLETRVEELERHLRISQQQYVETFHSLFETRALLRQVYEANMESVIAMNMLMRDDPAFMETKAAIEANF